MGKVKSPKIDAIQLGSRGIAVSMNKTAIKALMDGRTFDVDLITGDNKLRIMFMRDHVFKEMYHQFDKQFKSDKTESVDTENKDLGKQLGEVNDST